MSIDFYGAHHSFIIAQFFACILQTCASLKMSREFCLFCLNFHLLLLNFYEVLPRLSLIDLHKRVHTFYKPLQAFSQRWNPWRWSTDIVYGPPIFYRQLLRGCTTLFYFMPPSKELSCTYSSPLQAFSPIEYLVFPWLVMFTFNCPWLSTRYTMFYLLKMARCIHSDNDEVPGGGALMWLCFDPLYLPAAPTNLSQDSLFCISMKRSFLRFRNPCKLSTKMKPPSVKYQWNFPRQ